MEDKITRVIVTRKREGECLEDEKWECDVTSRREGGPGGGEESPGLLVTQHCSPEESCVSGEECRIVQSAISRLLTVQW